MSTLIAKFKSRLQSKPKALYILLSAEIPELMGRFGIMATLVLYLTNTLHLTDAMAFTVYSTFLMVSYITPIFGGFFADRYLGHQKAVILGACLMVVGNAFLMIPQLHFIYFGLSLMALGIGFFSPSLIALLNALYTEKDEGREQAFVLYYICRNVGALIAPTVCGVLGVLYGYNFAFLFTGLCMLAGLFIFIRGATHLPPQSMYVSDKSSSHFISKRFTAINRRSPYVLHAVLAVLLLPVVVSAFIFHLSTLFLVFGAIVSSYIFYRIYKDSNGKQRQSLIFILLSIIAIMVFFSIDQLCGASFNLFVERLINRSVFGMVLPTSVFFSINPLFMILFGGGIMYFINKIKRPNEVTAAFTKYILASGIFSLAMLVFVAAAQQASVAGSASGLYVVLCYCLCALAELCIVPIVIALIGRLAPQGKVALMMGIYQFGNAIASFATGKIAGMAVVSFSLSSAAALHRAALIYRHLFLELAIALAVVAVLLIFVRYFVLHLSLKPV